MQITVRVRPGASRVRVGGRYGGSPDHPATLIVAVTARAVDGSANAAVLAAVAEAFGIRPAQVRLRIGHRARTKVLELESAPPDAQETLGRLLER